MRYGRGESIAVETEYQGVNGENMVKCKPIRSKPICVGSASDEVLHDE